MAENNTKQNHIPFDKMRLFDIALKFTEVYKENYTAHPALREVLCRRELYPVGLYPLQPEDLEEGFRGARSINKTISASCSIAPDSRKSLS